MARSKTTFKDKEGIRTDSQCLVCDATQEFLGKEHDPESVLRGLLEAVGLNPLLNETWERTEELRDILTVERALLSIHITPGNDITETLKRLAQLGGDELRQAMMVVDPYTRTCLDSAALRFHKKLANINSSLPDAWHDITATNCLFDTIRSAYFVASDAQLNEIIQFAIDAHKISAGRRKTKYINFALKLAEWWHIATNSRPTASFNPINQNSSKFVQFTQLAIRATDNRELSNAAIAKIARIAIKDLSTKKSLVAG